MDAALRSGMRAHETGDLRSAETYYRQILAADGNNADALNLLGVIALQNSHPEAAIELIQKSLAINHQNPDGHVNLGAALLSLGQLPAALASFNRALAIDPRHMNAHYNSGLLFLDSGDFEQARKAFSVVIQIEPDKTEAVLKLGIALMKLGRGDEGLPMLRRAAAMAPGEESVHFNLAIALIRSRQLDEAEAELTKITGDSAPSPDVAFAFGQLFEARGHPARAVDYFRAVLNAEPDNAPAHFALGKQLMDLGHMREAEIHTRRSLELQPESPEVHCNLGLILDALGDHDEAVNCFRDAAEMGLVYLAESHIGRGKFDQAGNVIDELQALKPDHPCIYSLRSQIGSNRNSEDDRRRAEIIAEKGDGDPSDIADLYLALGRSYEADGAFDRAFGFFRHANDLLNSNMKYEKTEELRRAEDLIATFTPTFFERQTGVGSDSDVPVFVLGMPRSGTTLVEQIIASHPLAAGAGELRDMIRIQNGLPAAIGSDRPFPECAANIDRDSGRRLADEYLERLVSVAPDAARIVDKMPYNFRCLGLIALLFPKARIIHCTRDPRDICFSIYQHRFAGFHTYAYSLDRLGHYYRLYERLMAHWTAVLPLPIREVRYESLIANPEEHIKSLIDFLGLEWDNHCLEFHNTDRSIRTASAWQVRQPLYNTAVGRWRNYEAHLGELIDSLSDS
ncbi:MAG: sulfotransferase [Alphaproteobacteria bacterium]